MKIPQYTGNRELTTQSPNRLVDAASFAVKDARGEVMEKAGQAISAIGEHFGKIMDLQQTTQAQTEAARRLNDIHQKAVEDPDIWNAGKKAQDEILKVKSEIAPKIMNQMEREKFESSFDVDAMSYTNKINTGLRERQAVSAVNTLDDFTASKESEFINSDSSYDRQMILNKINDKYTDYVRQGVILPEKAVAAFKKTKEALIDSYAENYTNKYPGIALEELEAGKKGMFNDISEDKRLELEKTASALIKKNADENERAMKQIQYDNVNGLYEEKINGTLTVGKVKGMLEDKQIDAKSADVLIRSMQTVPGNPTDADKAKTYIDLVNRAEGITDKSTLKEISQLRLDAIEDNSKGLLSMDKLVSLFKDTDEKFTSKLNKTEKILRKKYGQAAFASINSWVSRNAEPAYKDETKASMYWDYISKVDSGKTPAEAIYETIQGAKKETPYKLNDFITNPATGETGKVVGFDDSGKPLVQRTEYGE